MLAYPEDVKYFNVQCHLAINTNKIKILNLTGHLTLPTFINAQSIEGVDQFAYLRSLTVAKTECRPMH